MEKESNEPSAQGGTPPPPPAQTNAAQRPIPAPPPLPPPSADAALRGRLERAETQLEELRGRLDPAGGPAGAGLRDVGQRLAGLEASVEGLKRTFASEGELAARLAQAESALASLRTAFDGQNRRLGLELDSRAGRDAVDGMRVELSAALSSIDEMKISLAQSTDELSSLGSECRRALGEAQGMLKAAEQNRGAALFDEHLREVVARLGARLSEMETAVHAGLAELSGRLKANEVLYQKMFSGAEERLAKSVEPQLKGIEGQLRWLRENLIRLSDDYAVVTERKIRALEAKYSAFEAISRRMDAIDAALKKGGRLGLP